MGCESASGAAANTTSRNESSSCFETEDGFVNFYIKYMYFKFDFNFILPKVPSDPIEGYNEYVEKSNFGVIAADVTTLRYRRDGKYN